MKDILRQAIDGMKLNNRKPPFVLIYSKDFDVSEFPDICDIAIRNDIEKYHFYLCEQKHAVKHLK